MRVNLLKLLALRIYTCYIGLIKKGEKMKLSECCSAELIGSEPDQICSECREHAEAEEITMKEIFIEWLKGQRYGDFCASCDIEGWGCPNGVECVECPFDSKKNFNKLLKELDV